MDENTEIIMAVLFAIVGIILIMMIAFSRLKKPRFAKWQNSKIKTIVLSVLFVTSILIGVGGIMLTFIGALMHFGIMILGILISLLSVVLSVLLAKSVEPNNNKATESWYNAFSEESAATDNKNYVADGERDYNYLEDIVDDNLLMYSYEKDICLFGDGYKYLAGNGGKDLRFVQEPENQYDSNAVAIYLENDKLGYIYRSDRTQKMINDWIKRREYFTGYLNKFSVADKKATFKIGFYKPLSIFPSKTFSLVRTGKRIDDISNRAENLRCCSEGDTVKIFESYEYPFSHTVCDDCGDEIGELPKSAERFLEDCDIEDVIGIIREIDDDYETAPKAKVEIYKTN